MSSSVEAPAAGFALNSTSAVAIGLPAVDCMIRTTSGVSLSKVRSSIRSWIL